MRWLICLHFRANTIRSLAIEQGKKNLEKELLCILWPEQTQTPSSFLGAHRKQKRITELRKFPVGSWDRLTRIQILINEGNFKHNLNVLKSGTGSLVVNRHCKVINSSLKPEDFAVCKDCKSFRRRKNLAEHQKLCVVKNEKSNPKESGKEEVTELPENYLQVTEKDVEEFNALLMNFSECKFPAYI